MMFGSSKKTKPLLSTLWPSFNAQEKSIRKIRRKENSQTTQDQVGANLWLISDPEVTIQALPCLCKVALEVNIQATMTMEDSKETFLQERLKVHQIMLPFMVLRWEPTGPQLGHIMTMDHLRNTDNKVSHMGRTIQGLRKGTMTIDLLKDMEDQTRCMGVMIQGLHGVTMTSDLLRDMKEVASHMGCMIQGLQRGTMTMDLPTDNKSATVAITGFLLTLLITNHPVAGKVDTVKLRPPMVSSMGNTMIAKVPHTLIRENKIITQGEYREGKHHRMGEVSSIGMEEGIRRDIRRLVICNQHCHNVKQNHAKEMFHCGESP